MNEEQLQWNMAARAELRRLVPEGLPPSGEPAEQFGPWAADIERLRAAHASGTPAVRELFLSMAAQAPALGRLLRANPYAHKTVWTNREMLEAKFPEMDWIVPDLVPEGCTLLAGRPSLDASPVAYQIAMAVSTGGEVLGRQVAWGKVLYLLFHAGTRRWYEGLLVKSGARARYLDVRCDWPALGGEGLAQLQAAVDRDAYRLVVVDTLAAAPGGAQSRDRGAAYTLSHALTELARDSGAAVVAVNHYRPRRWRHRVDPIADVVEILGGKVHVDTLLALYKGHGMRDAMLIAVGRDIPDATLAVTWEMERYRYVPATGA